MVEDFTYLHFENIPAFDELYLWQGYGQEYEDKFLKKLKTLILKDLPIKNEDAVKHIFNLEKLVIKGSLFKELDISLLEDLTEVDLQGNDSLLLTCVHDVNLAKTSSSYKKETINIWDGACGTASASNVKTDLAIYPNPTKGLIHFSKNIEFEIFDFLGNRIQVGNSNYANLSSHSSGLYFIRINDLTYKVTKKE